MPYIPEGQRQDAEREPRNPGELNYAITMLVMAYLLEHGRSYKHMSEVVGALECAKVEFCRRVMAPYEDAKCAENGDVYFD
jgi:hypothetical protein